MVINKVKISNEAKMDFNFELFGGNISESIDLLLRVALKTCEDEVVAAIGSFHFRINNITLRAPDVCGYDDVSDDIDEENFQFQIMRGMDAQSNKVEGLYVEKRI